MAAPYERRARVAPGAARYRVLRNILPRAHSPLARLTLLPSRHQTTSRLPSTLSWILRYFLPEIAEIFRIKPMPRNRVQHQKGLSDDAFERLYPDEEACRKAWLAWRWP